MDDVTPHELRTVELREAWRGYRQDDVDELLDRVALTLEGLYEKISMLSDRVDKAEAASGAEVDQMLRRTLMLAQQTADEAVAEATKTAAQTKADAEAAAAQLVRDAQAEAESIRNSERGRIELEINELMELRDQIAAHIDELDAFERDYRVRIRQMLESDLHALADRPPLAVGDRPTPPPGVAPAPRASSTSEPEISANPDAPAMRSSAPWPGPGRVTSPRDLDDEAFFASLREAVHDTSPLGPRDDAEHPLSVGASDDESDAGRFGALFRRRS